MPTSPENIARFQALLAASDLLVVGAGLFGLTIAERAAAHGYRSLVIDRRPHIGGNAFSFRDPRTDIEVHKYGPHFFHTNSKEVFDYLSRFTEWVPYELRTWTTSGGKVYPLPINLATICLYAGQAMSPAQARQWVQDHATLGKTPDNLEEKAISLIGRPLYEAFIRGYTMKQWQTDPTRLPPEIITRLPVRYTFDNRYFSDTYQYMPRHGYGAIFNRMVETAHITVMTEVDWFDIRPHVPAIPIVYTGPIDRFFDYADGELGWRTVDFIWEYHQGDYQGCPVMNYADESVPWTRTLDFRHMHPERDYGDTTIIAREYSRSARRQDEPYYPINTEADKSVYDAYRRRASSRPDVVFGGRLGTYRYLDMHQAVGAALRCWQAEVAPRL